MCGEGKTPPKERVFCEKPEDHPLLDLCNVACLALGLSLLIASSALADVVILKRSPDLTISTGLDYRFSNAISGGTATICSDTSTGQDMVDDTWLRAGYDYNDYGASPSLAGGAVKKVTLTKFNLSVLPGFVGGHVVKAQLRLYYTTGNTGLGLTGAVTSTDWAEGNKDGGFPGADPAAPGASLRTRPA